MLTQLKNFGLNEKEAKVYLAALELGSDTVINISKKAGVNRTTAYVEIEALMQMGLMSSFEKGKKRFFTAESPEGLMNVLTAEEENIKLRKTQLKELLPQLGALHKEGGDKPTVRFFEGKEAVKKLNERILELKKGNQVLSVYPADSTHEAYSDDYVEGIMNKRIKKGIPFKGLYTRKEGEFSGKAPQLTEDFHLPLDKYPLEGDLSIYDHFVQFQSLKGKQFGFIVDSMEFANSMRSIFKLAWERAEQLNKK